ncbi:tRNA uridine-5-carboxymethylaminomethyl(34) synthesis enzyme MnmG [Congregicoccus parvus]|uniref:tRNA uridine-5-carboxymethylaminomethyl(34) synthesis enzyme MnmG n=1 Tax=Congregicoccus parvus TaxID=3081749 RepID=UPI003FA5A944
MGVNFREEPFDVVVCGGGHAGVEAALAAARMGADTLLLTGNVDTIGQMSCNPAIGGVAKGHIVREIDALGGEMGITADVTGIQFRLLNATKGPAVQSPRAQCDKKAYQFRIKHTLELQNNLLVFQGTVSGLIFEGSTVVGCRTTLEVEFRAKSVIVTTGTFLRGLLHVGEAKSSGGRMGDYSSLTLSDSLMGVGIELRRLKTGTPPRVAGRSIDFGRMEEQRGDSEPVFFAFHDTRGDVELFHVERSGQRRLGWVPGVNQVSCWITHTSEVTERLVRDNLHRSAMYSGQIQGVGPRYCPSIEDKIVRFADKPRHMLFLEPEGRQTDEYYINGMSTSLPFDVQVAMVRSVPGLEGAQLIRPAYAVEYDFAPPTQLKPSLESKVIENLFFAGQINGTSGYEEAAGQGLVAGVNAVEKVRGRPAMILGRQESYIGVMIDDLVTKGTSEPYRMFTSRAEHRLLLNHGSAELRLRHHAEAHQLVDGKRLAGIKTKHGRVHHWQSWLESNTTSGGVWADVIRAVPNASLPDEFVAEAKEVRDEVLYRVRYKGYLERERQLADKLRNADRVRLPDEMDFRAVPGLKKETADKLACIRPTTLGQAQRVSGVTPADVAILMVHAARFSGGTRERGA